MIPGHQQHGHNPRKELIHHAAHLVCFHPRRCGPLATSLLQHRPDASRQPHSSLEAVLHKADVSSLDVTHIRKPPKIVEQRLFNIRSARM